MNLDGKTGLRIRGSQDLNFRNRWLETKLMSFATDGHRMIHTVKINVEDLSVDDNLVKRTACNRKGSHEH